MDERTDLMLDRVLNAPRERVWRAWTEPERLKQWWCPKPWRVEECRIDLRPGGELFTLMRGPKAGEEHAVAGCYLEIAPPERIVFTLVLQKAFRPAPLGEGAFRFTARITFSDAGDGKTLYRAHVMHANAEDRDAHARMGFTEGWAAAAAQLDELLAATREGA
jgi:uncharacterized protein YndB with AHSA1/START domain